MTMQLRPYQTRCLNEINEWFAARPTGNPVVVLPTGSGKAFVISNLVKNSMDWPGLRIAVITHSKELIEQDAIDLKNLWPNAPMGVCCSGLGKKEIGEPILYATVGSVWKKADEIGHIDLLIIDECDLINPNNQGMYRTLIDGLLSKNKYMRVIGFTATPYRMGHGLITDGDDSIWTAPMIQGASIEELIALGYLAPLHSKHTNFSYDTKNVKKRGGDFVEKDLQEFCNTDAQNIAAVDEIIARAGDRRHWLIFCTGVDHAHAVAAVFAARGVASATVLGSTPKSEREQILKDFKTGKIKAVANVDVLTVGFNFPDLDLIAFLRPTMSRRVYMQMAGRGTRLKSHTDHCLVIDMAGLVETFGPITVDPTFKPKGEGDGLPPLKSCPSDKLDINKKAGCNEIIHISIMTCPVCGFIFEPVKKEVVLHNDNIMKIEGQTMQVVDMFWKIQRSKNGGIPMIMAEFTGSAPSDPKLAEFFCVAHEGFAKTQGFKKLDKYFKEMGLATDGIDQLDKPDNMAFAVNYLNSSGVMPKTVEYKKKDKFWEILSREWGEIQYAPSPTPPPPPQQQEEMDDGW